MKRVAISASFTAEVLAQPLQFLLDTIAYDAEIVFAPYNQIFQELYNPNSLIRANDNGVNIILTRFEDWLHYQKGNETFAESRQVIEQNANELINGIANIPRHKAACIVCLAAPSPALRSSQADMQLHTQLEDLFIASLQDIQNVHLIRSGEIETLLLLILIDAMGFAMLTPLLAAALAPESNSPLAEGTTEDGRHLIYGFATGLHPIMMFFAAPILGQLSDRAGRKLEGRAIVMVTTFPWLWWNSRSLSMSMLLTPSP